jgi:hypothetical protein
MLELQFVPVKLEKCPERVIARMLSMIQKSRAKE